MLININIERFKRVWIRGWADLNFQGVVTNLILFLIEKKGYEILNEVIMKRKCLKIWA